MRRLEAEDLWLIPRAADPQRSPDGRHVAFVLTTPDRNADEDRSRIWLLDVASGSARPFTTGPDDSAPRWSPDGGSLAFTAKRHDDEAQLWVISMQGGEARRLTDLDAGVSTELAWSPDSQLIAVVAPVTDDGGPGASPLRTIERMPYKMDGLGRLPAGFGMQLFVVRADGEERLQLTEGELFVSSPAWSPGGDRLAFVASGGDWAREPVAPVYVVPADGGETIRVSQDDRWHSAVSWSPDGESLLSVGTDMRTVEHARLWLIPSGGGVPRELAPGFDRNVMVGSVAYPGAPPAYTPDGGRVVFCARDGGCTHLYEVDARGGLPRKVLGDEHEVVTGMSLGPGGIAVVVATPTTTGEIETVELDGSRREQLTSIFSDALPEIDLFVPESRTFTSPDGTQIQAWLLRGGGTASAPLLLDVHGGPHNAWSPAFDGCHLYQQALAAQGWNVLMVNPRGSDGFGEDFYTAAVGNWGLADEQDFLSAVDALVDDGIADPSRLAVGGYSYGGYMTCWLTGRTDRFATAVAGGVVSNLHSLYGTSAIGVIVEPEFGATPYGAPERLLERSPITHVGDVTTPTLILHGAADQDASVEQAEQWFAALYAQGTPVQMVLYPEGGHDFILSGPPTHRIDFNRRFAEWVVRHIS